MNRNFKKFVLTAIAALTVAATFIPAFAATTSSPRINKIAIAKNATLETGSSAKINVKISATANGNAADFTFASSNKNIVTVDAAGVMVAKGAGKASVRVKAKNGDAEAFCEVTVTAGRGGKQLDTFDPYGIIAQIVEGTNAARRKAGLCTLKNSDELNRLASIRAEEEQGTIDHVRPNGDRFYTVLNDSAFEWKTVGENLAMTWGDDPVPLWLESPTHRANIMNGNFNYIGIGVYLKADGSLVFSQLFIEK